MIGRLASSRTAIVGAGVTGAGLGIGGAALAAWMTMRLAELAVLVYWPGVAWGMSDADLSFLGIVAGCSTIGGAVGGGVGAAAVGARHVGEGWRPSPPTSSDPIAPGLPA